MKNKIKTMLHSVVAVGFALLFIVLFALPYCAEFNGYNILSLYKYASGFSAFMVSFFQFFHFVGMLLLLNLGILGILEKTGVVEFKKSLKNWSYNKLVKVVLLVIASLSVMVLLFTIIVCAKFGVYIGVGVILNAILEILACVVFWVLDKKGVLTFKDEEVVEETPMPQSIPMPQTEQEETTEPQDEPLDDTKPQDEE